jgi:mRNA interferase MazF
VSSNAYHNAQPDLVIRAVTSQVRRSSSFGEVMVQAWQAAGLLKPSAVKPVITTIEASLVMRSLGKLAQADVAALRRSLAAIFG